MVLQRTLTVILAFWPLFGIAGVQEPADKPSPVTAVTSVRLVESGAILAEDFDGPQLDLKHWRVWQENPDQTTVRQKGGRLVLTGQGRIGHNGLWGLTTAKYKDVVLVGQMDIRSKGSAPHRLALHLCGGDGARSPDHWVEIDMVDLGQTAQFSPMAALPLGLDRQQDKSLELPHPADQGCLCRLGLNGQTNMVDLSVKTDKGWKEICPPVALPLRTIHTEAKLHGNSTAAPGAVNAETKSQAWFDNVRIYPRPENHHVGVRLVRSDDRQIWFRESDGWPPRIIDGQGKSRSIEDLEVQLWTADGKTQVAASHSANMGFYLLPLKDAPWDVYPVAAELRVLLDGRILGKPLEIVCQGMRGLYPDDVYDVIVAESGKATSRPGASPATSVRPARSSEVLLNPGKGWVLYGMAEWQTPEALAIGAIGYHRFTWSDLEPSEGQFNWKPLEDALAGWDKAGKQFAFGVMCANSHSHTPYVTPKWVFEAGAKCRLIDMKDLPNPYAGIPGLKAVPDFRDPIFLAKLRAFLNAMANRYDGDPRIAFIDIRSYGNWGEGHMWPFGGKELTSAEFKNHVRIHMEAFGKSLLCISAANKDHEDVYDWAAGKGVAVRRDGICANSDGSETMRAFGYAPGIFEFYGSYTWLKEKGWWYDKGDNGHGHKLTDCVENGKPSYIGLSLAGKESFEFLAAERPLIDRLANRMGYHFVLKEAVFPTSLSRGTAATVKMTWANEGVAPIYVPCAVAIALIDARDQPVDICWPMGQTFQPGARQDAGGPGAWLPDKAVTEESEAVFAKAPAGQYRLAIGLVRRSGNEKPWIGLGILGRTEGGWYPLDTVRMER